MSAPTLFLSDLHLGRERPEKLAGFRRLMREEAPGARAVYILGDLFEQFWAGADDHSPPNAEIIEILSEACGAGARLYFQRGNRELMLTPAFQELTGCMLLPDECVLELDGERVLLMHGDRLCSRDWQYQLYRRCLDTAAVQGLFHALPSGLRLRLVHGLRPWMKRAARGKPPTIMDADQPTIEDRMRQHGVTILIHGHTHRPGVHAFDLDGQPARRFVLGDWYAGDTMLMYQDGVFRLVSAEALLSGSEEIGQ